VHGTKTSSTSAPPRKRMITAVLPCHNPTALSSRKNQLIALEELPLRLRTSPCRAQPCPPASGSALNAVLLNFWCGTKNYWRLVELFPARPLGSVAKYERRLRHEGRRGRSAPARSARDRASRLAVRRAHRLWPLICKRVVSRSRACGGRAVAA
jgi:hypothetical protein